jgi:DNA repair exonuclease SbcCD ATPase subunit
MSQIETLMVLGLGSALTFVFFLLFGRVFWNVAASAGARRSAKQVPVTMLELQADRDRLRAEHALMSRKLELRLEDIKSRMTEQMAEVSRNRNRVQSLLLDLESKDDALKQRDRDLVAARNQIEAHEADLMASNQTIENLVTEQSRKEEELSKLQDAFRQMSTHLRDKNALVGNLNEELRTALSLKQSVPVLVSPTPENRLMQRVAELTNISTDMARHTENAFAPQVEITQSLDSTKRLQNKVNEAELDAHAMERELEKLDQMLANSSSSNKVVPGPAPAAKKSGAMANVISLAQRIRALQQGMNE